MYINKTISLLGIAALVLISGACTKKFLDTDLERATRENEEEIVMYLQNNNLNYTKAASGIHYQVTTTNPGGKSVELGDQARVFYKLTLINNSVIDTVLTGQPFAFGYYSGSVFEGFLESVSLLKEGEKGTFLIPSSLAFQNQRLAGIPMWSVVKADIEIVTFRDEEEQIAAYVTEKGFENVEITSTDLRFIPLTEATSGSELASGDEVVLKYKGSLLNDVVFDEGEFTVSLGAGSVIPGFEEGIKKMKVGQKATIIFPSEIGYDTDGSGQIPPFSPLRFDLEILSKR
jgi:FKBP-type peptidyl-prolyl cis-trans isomerase